MRTSFRATREGSSLRSRLAPLVILALLGVSLATTVEVRQRVQSVQSAAQAQALIRATAAIDSFRAAVEQEVVPGFAFAVARMPSLLATPPTPAELVPATAIFKEFRPARARTDVSLAALSRYPEARTAVEKFTAGLVAMRSSLDRPISLSASLAVAVSFIATVADVEDAAVARASGEGLDPAVTAALGDVDLLAHAAQSAGNELLLFTVMALSKVDPAAERANWIQGWGDFASASHNVAQRSSPVTAAAWKTVNDSVTVAAVNRLFQDNLQVQDSPGLISVIQLALRDGARKDAYRAELASADSRALLAGAHQRSAALNSLAWLIVIAVLLIGISIVVAVLVRRSVTKSLDVLARQATQVSKGELVDVEVNGAREVRVVARALSAAVASLRNIEAQAAAVASGDLDSDVVRTALPGPLGAVVHSSVTRILRAINEREIAQDELAHRASHDALTELPNRAEALVLIAQALHRAQRASSKTSLMFIDLDYFKAVNDNFGHAAGDEVLQTVSRRMLRAVRDGDSVARLGGDEFVVLLEHVDDEGDVVKLAHRLIEAVSADISLEGRNVRVGASAGVAFCRDGYVDADRLLQEADAAAYRAKTAGRGRVDVFDDDLRAALQERAALENAMAAGLEAGEFILHYQPVVDLTTGRTRGFEALIRWDRPGHGLVLPDDFIPVAEQSTLINDIGRWVLHRATAQLAEWLADEPDSLLMNVAVNISGRHLASNRLLTDVTDALESSGLPATRLVVEITETVLVDDPVATSNMHALRKLGVQISLDDFGSGYTSIGQLPKLPVDTLKIDRSFAASSDPAYQELVRLIVGAAHAFGLSVVAEGIEKQDQANRLRDVDTELGQGFLFARPAPAIGQFQRDQTPPVTDPAPA